MRRFIALTLAAALRHVIARAAVAPPPPMQRKAVGLTFEPVLSVPLMGRSRRSGLLGRRAATSTGNEGGQTLHVAVVVAMRLGILVMSPAEILLLAW